MPLDEVITHLAERYCGRTASTVKRRKRRSALDSQLPVLCSFTLRRLDSLNPRQFSLRKLAIEIEEKTGRLFTGDAVRDALIKHNLYQLWESADENP
ncbi:hypothetical protein LMG28614_05505 [Paraburkholderia ultramafica]|uniref:Uncharacterized protein n=2 Tax=Paraburkholderia ultramafica TaxID=1544867 RepID=A0A6S7C5K8_9BURK|nr:hypothetical protein LMG28614_05505 [Paraburkholderia ultramafica]